MAFTLSLIVISATCFCLIRAELSTSSLHWLSNKYAFIVPLSFSLTLALVGLISNTGFYLDIPTSQSIYIVYLVAVLLGPSLWTRRRHLTFRQPICGFDPYRLILITTLLYLACLYLHRALAPWSDTDEINVYGVMVKLIAHGMTLSLIHI